MTISPKQHLAIRTSNKNVFTRACDGKRVDIREGSEDGYRLNLDLAVITCARCQNHSSIKKIDATFEAARKLLAQEEKLAA